MALQQNTIDHLNKTIRFTIDMWTTGLITDRELAKAIAEINAEYVAHSPANGEIDPNTGLRYGA